MTLLLAPPYHELSPSRPTIMESVQHLKHTSLHSAHRALGAKLVPFAGWEMPIQYQSILAEARAVRTGAGIFDVSHMGRLHLIGPGAAALLDWVLTAPVREMGLYRARYTLLLTKDGGIIDDGIVYRLGQEHFLLVANAANRQAVMDWLLHWRSRFGLWELEDRTEATAMIALQGPRALEIADELAQGTPSQIRLFHCQEDSLDGIAALVARTGYTGEDGFEFIVEAAHAPALWQHLLEAGAVPCGLGARDLLRLEAGLLLHGSDMNSSINPLEAGLERFARLDQGEFCGVSALRSVQREGLRRNIVGFQLLERGIPRHGYTILHSQRTVGEVTSGGYSPTLDRSIGLGYVASAYTAPGTRLTVDLRGRPVDAEVVKLPFYSRKKA